MKVFITGINGFIGSQIARHLHANGMKIYGSSRAARVKKDLERVITDCYHLALNREFDVHVFKGMGAVVHCAHAQKGDNLRATNTEGTKKWFNAARDMGVNTQVFITTYSARPESKSEYGQIKYGLENFFIRQNQPVIRPGLVLGRGGLFGRMARAVKSYPAVPLIDGGRCPVPIISIQALCQVVGKVLESPTPRVYQAFQQEMVSLRQLLQEVKRQSGARCLFLNIPSFLPLTLLKTLEALHIPFPINSDRITGLKEFQAISLPSSLAQLGIQDKTLAEIVSTAIEGINKG